MSTTDSSQRPQAGSLIEEPILVPDALDPEVITVPLHTPTEPSVSPPPVLNTVAPTEPVAQDPGAAADPVESHARIPKGFNPKVLVSYRFNNIGKGEPATVPNLAGKLPRTGLRKIYKIHNRLSNDGIRAVYSHYQLRYPSCEGLSDSEARRFRLSELEAYHRPKRRMQIMIDTVQFYACNERQYDLNSFHENREEEIEVLNPLRPVGFVIPNTVPGLEQLSVEQKRELLTACCQGWDENDLDGLLMKSILVAFNLLRHYPPYR